MSEDPRNGRQEADQDADGGRFDTRPHQSPRINQVPGKITGRRPATRAPMVVPPNKGSHHHPGRTIATVAEPPHITFTAAPSCVAKPFRVADGIGSRLTANQGPKRAAEATPSNN